MSHLVIGHRLNKLSTVRIGIRSQNGGGGRAHLSAARTSSPIASGEYGLAAFMLVLVLVNDDLWVAVVTGRVNEKLRSLGVTLYRDPLRWNTYAFKIIVRTKKRRLLRPLACQRKAAFQKKLSKRIK